MACRVITPAGRFKNFTFFSIFLPILILFQIIFSIKIHYQKTFFIFILNISGISVITVVILPHAVGKKQTVKRSGYSENKHHECRSRVFAGSEQKTQHSFFSDHKRFAHVVDHKSAKQKSEGNGEKLECISARINPSLKIFGN